MCCKTLQYFVNTLPWCLTQADTSHFVLNMLILINDKLGFETSAHQVLLLLYQSVAAKWYD